MNDNDRNGEESFSFLFSIGAGATGNSVGWSAGMYWLLAIEISTCVVRGNNKFSLEENLGIRISSTTPWRAHYELSKTIPVPLVLIAA